MQHYQDDSDLESILRPDREYAPASRPRRKAKKRSPKFWLITALILVLLAAGSWIGVASLNKSQQPSNEVVSVRIPSGSTGDDIAEILEQAGVLTDRNGFYRLLLTQDISLRAGNYRLNKGLSAQGALAAMLDPNSRIYNGLTIPEGHTLQQILELLAEKTGIALEEFKQVAADLSNFEGLPAQAKSVEGFLFPATYDIEENATAKQLLVMMHRRMLKELSEVGVDSSRYWDTVVMAALVQKEGGNVKDFTRIARVFMNRLDEGMLLQSDATIHYGTGKYDEVTTTDAEREDAGNLYNTYVHPGLPPGPISNPGYDALNAVINPASGKWLFFVTWNQCTGETIFSETFAEHEAGVDKWLKWRKEHGSGSC